MNHQFRVWFGNRSVHMSSLVQNEEFGRPTALGICNNPAEAASRQEPFVHDVPLQFVGSDAAWIRACGIKSAEFSRRNLNTRRLLAHDAII